MKPCQVRFTFAALLRRNSSFLVLLGGKEQSVLLPSLVFVALESRCCQQKWNPLCFNKPSLKDHERQSWSSLSVYWAIMWCSTAAASISPWHVTTIGRNGTANICHWSWRKKYHLKCCLTKLTLLQMFSVEKFLQNSSKERWQRHAESRNIDCTYKRVAMSFRQLRWEMSVFFHSLKELHWCYSSFFVFMYVRAQ